MLLRIIYFIFIISLFYQSHSYSKSTSSKKINLNSVSKYFSGIVAFENKNNSKALDFFNSSKILLNTHEPYLKRYIFSLVLDNKISNAINVVKENSRESSLNFFDANLLLIIDKLKKNNLDDAYNLITNFSSLTKNDRLNEAILDTLKQYIYVFKEKKFSDEKSNFGTLTTISETFQNCYLDSKSTESYFLKLFNDPGADYTRYIFFYLSYLIENNEINDAKNLIKDIDYINSTLLLSQGKNWIENGDPEKIVKVFSCKNSNDIISEFLFLISNLYSSQDNFDKSNFYLNLSYYLNPKFIYNLSLVADNQYLNKEYSKAKKTLKNFKKEDLFYYWYRVKKEAQIVSKEQTPKKSLDYLKSEFDKIKFPNNKFLFDIANFYKNSKKYEDAIKYYTEIIENYSDNSEIKSDVLYRRGGSYERLGMYDKSDNDLLHSLKIVPDDAFVLNYLAYSWLERNYKINEAIEMLETAYAIKNNDPYIIDSIGWAYYLIKDYVKAEELLRRAVELMPDDPIVNDHYGDILWRLDRKIQARYFWSNVLSMKDVEKELTEKINSKLINGLKNS
tara:strand:+ start:1030 stop:2715 length:1686 start_codon:yes stop_codon:yes gene_type:complete